MSVHPEIQQILDTIKSRNPPPIYTLTPAEAREAMLKARKIFVAEPPAIARVEDREMPGPGGPIKLRLFADSKAPNLPLLLWFHGGGWVIGNLDTHHDLCCRLARHTGALVVSVDYRLAPEHKFPACVDDAVAALHWAAHHGAEIGGDPARIAVGGDSAGGHLAAVVSQVARDAGGPTVRFQLLVYPAVLHDLTAPSMIRNAKGYFLETEGMRWFYSHWFKNPKDVESPLAGPMRAKSLQGLPAAYVVTAGYDPLCDEGTAYAKRLKESGVRTLHKHYEDATHAFFTMTVTKITNQAIQDASKAVRAALAE
jgi:acetyl esterase